MILAVDAGNTNIVLGVFEGDKLLYSARIATDVHRTADEFGFFFKQVLAEAGGEGTLKGGVIASVVPGCNYALSHSFRKYFDLEPIIVSGELNLGVKYKIDNPYELGADLIANAVGAVSLYKGEDVIVVDFGTATTFSVITKEKEVLGGAICCGMRTALGALSGNTAKLPWITIGEPSRVIGSNTIECMLSGAVYGYTGLVDGMIERMAIELGRKPKVVATGGLSRTIAPYSKSIDIVHGDLTLIGLREIFTR